MNREQNNKAFTLIELLVVIAIIALLLSIIAPAMRKAKEQTRQTICRTHLRSVGLGLMAYLEENDGRTYNSSPANGFLWVDSAGNYLNPNTGDAYWGLAYIKYIENPEVFGCPSFKNVAELIYPVNPSLIHEAAFALNANFSNIKVGQIRTHSTFIITHDHVEPKVENGSQDMFHNDGPGTMNLRHYRQGGSRSRFYRGIFRHNIRSNEPFRTAGNANILWLDGHVEPLAETTGDNVLKSWYTGVKN